MSLQLPTKLFAFGSKKLDLGFTRVMGILNITPDSFSDGGDLYRNNKPDLDKAMSHAADMVAAGADIIDIGGESTRPGAGEVNSQEEIDRVLPLLELMVAELDTIISVDTSNPALILLAAKAGAGLINDVRALQSPEALDAAAATGLPVCLMHMQGSPGTMQKEPRYQNIIEEISEFLTLRVDACVSSGINRDRILVDPGFGFGKTLEHNLALLSRLDSLLELELPIVAGLSRKAMIGALTGREPKDRLAGSLAAAVVATMKGASIIRTHDVAETVDAIKVCNALKGAEYGENQDEKIFRH